MAFRFLVQKIFLHQPHIFSVLVHFFFSRFGGSSFPL